MRVDDHSIKGGCYDPLTLVNAREKMHPNSTDNVNIIEINTFIRYQTRDAKLREFLKCF
jgi:hypothetical protein